MGPDEKLDSGAIYFEGQPFESTETELEPAHPDDLPEVIPKTPDSMELTLTLTPEGAKAIVEALTPVFENIAQKIQTIAKWASEALKKMAATICDTRTGLIEALLYNANEHPKWWHLYKNAKKARTRKKYRRRLMQQLHSKLAGAKAQEVNP